MEFRAAAECELDQLAKTLIEMAGNYSVWLFYGEMGAGKTALIRHICAALGVIDQVSSPSFNIIHEYRTLGGKLIYHFDFYRLVREEEGMDLGIDEYFESGNRCLIEWPERIPSLLPNRYAAITMRIDLHHCRIITLKHHG